jgi:hypothetical protein
VTSRAELYTQMIVHPNGIAVPNWIFTTATNRTELTIEVVGIYIGAIAALGVFDWSCQPDIRARTKALKRVGNGGNGRGSSSTCRVTTR